MEAKSSSPVLLDNPAMNKFGSDPKVKKTLLRNYEHKVKTSASTKQVIHDAAGSSAKSCEDICQYENELGLPTLCSSDALANYLADAKKCQPPTLHTEDLNVNKGHLTSKMTKKLNFHFNDKIYKNLIELNSNMDELKSRKEKRPSSSTTSMRKDLEPNIEDFYEDEKEIDSPPAITIIKPKFRPIRNTEDGQLHRLVAQLEDL